MNSEPALRLGREDPALSARIVAVHALDGVRAGSALLAVDQGLLAVQDDAWSVAWISLPDLSITPQILKGDGGPLAKKLKPDFESAFSAADALWLLGSGSKAGRCCLARLGADGDVLLREIPELYAAVRQALGLSERPNIEGVLVEADRLRLLHRGAGTMPSAVVDVALAVLDGAPPSVLGAQRFDLGALDGVALHFTDAAHCGERSLFLAAAERTSNAIDDGSVAGSALGIIDRDQSLRWARLYEADGQASRRKTEGLVVSADCSRAWVLTDPDAVDRPAELCQVRLSGYT